MALVSSALAVVKGLSPGTVRYGRGGELVKALAQELRPGVAKAMGEAFPAGLGSSTLGDTSFAILATSRARFE